MQEVESKPLIILEDDDTFYYVSYQPYNSITKLPEYSVYINKNDLKSKNSLVNKDVVDNTNLYKINKLDFLNNYKENKILKIQDLYLNKQLQIYYNLSKNLNQQELLEDIKNKIKETTDLIYQIVRKNEEKDEY